MKVFKKFLAALIAVAMAFATLAFAACGKDESGNDGDDGKNNGDTGIIDASSPAGKLLTAVAAAPSNAEFTAGFSEVGDHEFYLVSTPDGEKPAETQTLHLDDATSVTGKADLENGDADVTSKHTEQSKWDSPDAETDVKEYEGYNFLRDWHAFGCDAPRDDATGKVKPITDFTNTELAYLGNLNEILGDLAGQIGAKPEQPVALSAQSAPETGATGIGAADITALATPALAQVNSLLIKLAVAADALKEDNGVYTVDLIKTLNKFYTDIAAAVNSLNDNTTVGDLLSNASLKKYLSLITETVPAQTVYEAVSGLVKTQSSEMQLLLSFLTDIKPDANSATYDYLVKLISSNGLQAFINTMLKAQTGAEQDVFTTTLDKAKVKDLLAMAGTDIATVKAMLTNLPFEISDTQLKVKIVTKAEEGDYNDLDQTVTFTEVKLGYTVADGKLTGQTASFKSKSDIIQIFANENDESGSYGGNMRYERIEIVDNMEASASITYTATAPALTDISGCKVSKEEGGYGFADGYGYVELRFNPQDFGYNCKEDDIFVSLTAKVDASGDVVGVYVNYDNENPVADGTKYTLSKDIWVLDESTDPPQSSQQKVQFDLIFNIEQVDSETVRVTMSNDKGEMLDVNYIGAVYMYNYYTSTVAKILSGNPDWTLVAD